MGIDLETIRRAEAEGRLIITDYPYSPRPRPFANTRAGQKITGLLQASRPHFARLCQSVLDNAEWFRRIPVQNNGPEDPTPCWINGMQPGLDGMLLYTIARMLNPRTYLEVGSGNSTKFIRRAIVDHGLQTEIISIDPEPRARVDDLCDRVIRKAFEDVPEKTYSELLRVGDMVFIDNSHRCFQNSDVTVFFTEVLPVLPSGVVYGLHDIFLPGDYPIEWKDRFYNEQYMLITYLLGGASGDKVICPGMFLSHDPQSRQALRPLFEEDYFRPVERHAGSFWLERSNPLDGERDRFDIRGPSNA